MDEVFSRLIDELQSLGAEDDSAYVGVGTEPRLTEAVSEPQPAEPPAMPAAIPAFPAMPLPRTVRGRRY